jgi:UDP-N-acetyl-D-glucosamine dehydrogenase
MAKKNTTADNLFELVSERKATIGIIGLGYVGLPLAFEFAKAGYPVLGFDIDPKKVEAINSGKTYIEHITEDKVKDFKSRKGCRATTNFAELKKADAILICVPTPLTHHREPDMSYIESTSVDVAKYLRKGQLIVLESTTYPGCTKDIILPKLEAKKMKAGKDFFLAFSPEREDPGNPNFGTATIPKVVGGFSANCRKIACKLYDSVVTNAIPVSSCEAAEATKLLENIFRSVNIALVNELKVLFDKMGIDVHEVINAAKTKPFGYMPFYPGPGLGGHCIPIDPFYLTWKAREYEFPTRFIELAGEINTNMPYYVIERTIGALNDNRTAIKGAKILLLGAAYKANVDDMRESPSLKLIDLLEKRGAKVDYSDPHVPALKPSRDYNFNKKSVKLTAASIKKYDALLIATAHNKFDYKLIGQNAKLIIDTRNAMANNSAKRCKAKIVTA